MEDKEKQIFDEMQEKQSALAKKLILGVLGGIGVLFAVIGIVFVSLGGGFHEVGVVFSIVGTAMLVLGVILFLVIPTKYNYDKYKSYVKKSGGVNVYEMYAKIDELEERISALEKELNNKM